jgi:hypothetical protein
MKFRLMQKSADRLLTKFHVLNAAGDIIGSVNVKNHEVRDLLRCWSGAADWSPSERKQPSAGPVKLKPLPPMSRQAILRGC